MSSEGVLAIWDWLKVWTLPITGASLALSVGGILVAGWMVVRLPANHFVRPAGKPEHRHQAIHAAWVVIRNALGIALLTLGIAMLVLPGQGLLAIAVGLSLMDFPGKHRLLEWSLRSRSVRRTLNWLRDKGGREPLQFPQRFVG